MREEGNRMNKELMRRIKLAGSYQRKAVLALLPEGVSEHLDVIGRKMQAIAFEVGAQIVKDLVRQGEDAAPEQTERGNMQAGGAAEACGRVQTGGAAEACGKTQTRSRAGVRTVRKVDIG